MLDAQDDTITVTSRHWAVWGLVSVLCALGAAGLLGGAIRWLIGVGHDPGWVWGGFGVLLSVISIAATGFVAFAVYRLQEVSAARDMAIVHDLARSVAESQQAIEVDPDDSGAPDSVSSVDTSGPSNGDQFVSEIRKRGGSVSAHPKWRRKVPCDGGRGNYGWFAEHPDTGERWFVRSGRGAPLVRRAIPRRYLDAWQRDTGFEPCMIRLDYQTKLGGNSAWYVVSFPSEGGAEREWKISFGGRGKKEATVTEMTPSD